MNTFARTPDAARLLAGLGVKSTLLELERPTLGFQGDEKRAPFLVDFPFVKAVGSKGDIEIRGYASTWVEDRDGEYVDPDAFTRSLPLYLQKNPMVLYQHDMDKPIGSVREAAVDDFGLNVMAIVPPPAKGEPDWLHLAYNKIEKGILKTFSIGGFFTREFVMGRSVIKEIELMEISVVSIPSNPDSIFEAAVKAVKAGTTSRRPTLLQGHIKQMKQILGVEPLSDPELVVMTPAERVARYELLKEAYLKAGKTPPDIDEWKTLEPRVLAAKGDDIIEVTPQLTSFIRKVNGGVIEIKRGRVLSGQNEQKLREVRDLLTDAEKQIDDWAEKGKQIVADTRSELDVVLKQVAEEEEGKPDDDPPPPSDPAEVDPAEDPADDPAAAEETPDETPGGED